MKYFKSFKGREDKFTGMASDRNGKMLSEFENWLQKKLNKFAGENVVVIISQITRQDFSKLLESFEQEKKGLVFA